MFDYSYPDYSYPRVKQSLGRAALHDTYPALLLDPCCVILGANLMAFWLYDLLRPGEPLKADVLLGESAFQLIANNFERIPVELNAEFYAKRSSLVKRAAANLHSPLFAPFIAAMQADPRRAEIYEHAAPQVDREWEYPLTIAAPGSQDEFLEFQVAIFRLEGNAGFLVVYSPLRQSQAVIEEQYSQLRSANDEYVYGLPDATGQNGTAKKAFPLSVKNYGREYYPTLIQDPLWYVVGENRAMQLVVGQSGVGAHFFEIYFAPQLQPWMGPLQETSAPRALRYFDTFTASFLDEAHELHAEYVRLMQRLMQLPDFVKLLNIARKLNIHINLPDDFEVPFYSCRVILPWRLSPDVSLQFRSMVRLMQRSLLVDPGEWHCQVTLVPENYPTEAALILLHLFSSAHTLDDSVQQMLWGLAIMQTVREGLNWKDEGASNWEPEAACARMYGELAQAYPTRTADAAREVIGRLRAVIEWLDRQGMVDAGILLSMLQSCTATQASLYHLAAFCARELEIRGKVAVEAGVSPVMYPF